VTAGAMCTGQCNGSCTYTPGMVACNGDCHGSCSAQASPPRCDGKVDCMASATCNGNCQASANVKANCSGATAAVKVVGDAKLQAAVEAHSSDWAAAFSLFARLKDPAVQFVNATGDTLKTLGDIGATGAVCITETLSVTAKASVSFNASVSAS